MKKGRTGLDNGRLSKCIRRQMKHDMQRLKRYAKYYLKRKFKMKKEYLPLTWLELNVRITEFIENTWETTNIDNLKMARETIRDFIDRLYDELEADRRPLGNENGYKNVKQNARKKGRSRGGHRNRMHSFRRLKMKAKKKMGARIGDKWGKMPDRGVAPRRTKTEKGRHRNKKSLGSLSLGGNILGAFSAANAVSEAGENFRERVSGYSDRGRSYFESGGSIATPTIALTCVLILAALVVTVHAL